MDIAGFLRRYPPFDELSDERLATVAGAVEIEHVAAGATILRQRGEPAGGLYLVRKGAVELLDDGRVLDLLGEGELFGQFSLLAHEGPTVTVRADEDTLLYVIPEAVADEVLETPAGRHFMVGSMRRRVLAAAERADPPAPDARLSTVGSLVRRPPVTVAPSVTVTEAATTMAAERVSSLLIPTPAGLGILTDRDLRTRVVAARGAFDTPVADVATFPARCLPADTLAGDALLAMFAEGVHHFPVQGSGGEILGVVTDTDLMGLGRHTPFALKSAIERASTPEAVAAAGRDLPAVVVAMVEAHADPVDVGRVAALAVDAMTERLLQLGVGSLGDPPASWAWLALGSAARHEQALRTDQDHAIAYDVAPEAVEAIDPYFAKLAGIVTDGLEAAGIPRCNGDAMAVHSAMRAPIARWVERFEEWMADATGTSIVLSSIGYDFRRVAGPLVAEPPLDEAVRKAAGKPGFVRSMSRRALDLHPPTGFLRDLVVERSGEHAGRLDVKHGGLTIVTNLARVYAVQAGVAAKPTILRLEAAAAAGVLDRHVAGELTEAFRFLWGIRLRHQASQVEAGEDPDDYVDPGALGPLARSGLKEAFRAIARAQRQLASEQGVEAR
ncbi:MAG: putative nucleotidyltransferase substrate binding domain-containing protein [Actinomycetota bacterium]